MLRTCLCQLLIFALRLFANGQVDWPQVQPDAARIDRDALTALSRDLSSDAHQDIKGLVILRDNQLIAEYYFNGGNKIYIIPSLGMVVAITSSAYNQKYGQRRSQDILLKVLAATRP